MIGNFLKNILYTGKVCFRTEVPRGLKRDESDRAVAEFKKNISRLPVSIVYRVKNGEETFYLSLMSVVHIASEIILYDNGSTDRTKDIFYKVKKEYENDGVSFKYCYDTTEYARAGENYKIQVLEGKTPLSVMYNKAFSEGKEKYLMKMDAHYMLVPSVWRSLEKKISKSPLLIRLKILDVFGRNHGYEPLMFYNDNWKFVDCDFYEILVLKKRKLSQKIFNFFGETIFKTAVLHLKRLGK